MKYVKLFESWLNEDESGDKAKVTRFNKTKPRSWPVSKTKILDVYQNGTPDPTILKTILGRAKQESDKEFNKDAQVFLIPLGQIETSENGFIASDGSVKLSGVAATASTGFRSNALKFRDKEASGLTAIVYGLSIDGNRVDSDPDNFLGKDGRCILILPENLNDISISPTSLISELPIIAKIDGSRKGSFDTKLANAFLFINGGGDTQSFNEKAGSITDTSSNVGGIFKGETEEDLLSYAKTIKMPGGGDLAVGDQNQNGLYKISQGGATKYLGQIKFEFDSDKLTEEAKATLNDDAVKGALVTADKTIVIVGHADGKGEEKYNLELSKRRAKSVLKYLESLSWFKKISAKVTTDGVGESQPIAPDENGTKPTEAALNRRVEFIVDAPADTKGKYDSIKDAAKVK